MNEKEKKLLVILGGATIIFISLLLSFVFYFIKKEEDAAYYSSSDVSETQYDVDNTPILLDQTKPSKYESLYGTGVFSLTDKEFEDICSSYFSGEKEATDNEIVDQLIKLKNFYRKGDFQSPLDELVLFGKEYSLPDNNFARELASYFNFIYLVKDLSTLDENGDIEAIQDVLNTIKNPEVFLLCTMSLSKPYNYYLDLRSICVDSIIGLNDSGNLLSEDDNHYSSSLEFLTEKPLAIYRFSLKYNDSIEFYAYVLTDTEQKNYILSIENTDGSFISPFEKKYDTDFNSTEQTIHFEFDKEENTSNTEDKNQ